MANGIVRVVAGQLFFIIIKSIIVTVYSAELVGLLPFSIQFFLC